LILSKAFICSRGDISANSNLQAVRTLITEAFPMLKPAHIAQLFSGVPCILIVGDREQLAAIVPRFKSLGLMVDIVDSASKLRALSFAKLNWLGLLPEATEIDKGSATDNRQLPSDNENPRDAADQTEAITALKFETQSTVAQNSAQLAEEDLADVRSKEAEVLGQLDGDDISIDFSFAETGTRVEPEAESKPEKQVKPAEESDFDMGALDNLSLGMDDDLAAELQALKSTPKQTESPDLVESDEASVHAAAPSEGMNFELVDQALQESDQPIKDEGADEVPQESTSFNFSNLSLAPLDEDESKGDDNTGDDAEAK
jgi:hypothetical protein